jgi:hypothetical protein
LYIYPLSRIHNASLTSAYFGLDNYNHLGEVSGVCLLLFRGKGRSTLITRYRYQQRHILRIIRLRNLHLEKTSLYYSVLRQTVYLMTEEVGYVMICL